MFICVNILRLHWTTQWEPQNFKGKHWNKSASGIKNWRNVWLYAELQNRAYRKHTNQPHLTTCKYQKIVSMINQIAPFSILIRQFDGVLPFPTVIGSNEKCTPIHSAPTQKNYLISIDWYAQCLHFLWKSTCIFHFSFIFFLFAWLCVRFSLFMWSSVFPYQIISLRWK